MATATALLDPAQLVTEIPDDTPLGTTSLSDMVSQTQRGMTVADLPVDDVPLDGEPEETPLTPAEQAELAATQIPEDATRVAPDSIAPALPNAEAVALQSLQANIARLEADLAALRAHPTTTPAQDAAATAAVADEIVDRLAQRYQRTFDTIEGLDTGEADFVQQRAKAYARDIYEAVLEVLGSEPAQQRVQPVAERVATAKAQELLQQDRAAQSQQTASETIFQAAVAKAREAGYDVHHFNEPGHRTSRDSRQFWALANTVYEPGMTPDQEITATLALMPPKVTTPTPTPTPEARPRAQPMGRGASPVAPGATTTTTEQPYQPLSLNGMVGDVQRINRLGA